MKKFFLAAALLFTGFISYAQVTELDSIVIVATRAGSKTPVAQTTIHKEIVQQNKNGRDLPYLLELLPGVVSYSDNGTGIGSTSFRIRGSDASRTNISIDGVTINDAESQSVFWVNIPDLASITNSIQVQRGVGTSAFGVGAFGGLVNIESRETSANPFANVEGYYGSFNAWQAGASVGSGKLRDGFAFDAHYAYVSSDGYLDRSGMWQQSARINGSWEGRNHLLKASVLYGEQHSMLTFDGVPYDSLATNRRFNMSGIYYDNNGNRKFYDNETDNYQQTQAQLHYIQKISDAWKMNATLYYTKGKGYYEQYKENTSYSKYGIPSQVIDGITYKKGDLIRRKGLDNDYYGANLTALYNKNRWNITLGAAASRYDGDHIGTVVWTQYNTGDIDYMRHWYLNTGVKDEFSAFAKLSFDILPTLSVFGDVQYRGVNFEMDGEDDDFYEKPLSGYIDTSYVWNFVNPKIGFSFHSKDKKHSAFASFAIGNREPNRSDLKDADKNGIRTPPQAETLYDYEVGYNFYPSFGRFGINLYYMDYKNQIVATGRFNDAYRAIMENVDKSYRRGIEITAMVRPAQKWQIEANLALSQNKILDYTNYVDQCDNSSDWNYMEQRAEYFDETDIAYSPSVVGAAIVQYRPLTGLTLALSGKYVGAQYYDNTSNSSRQLDAYFTSNFISNYEFQINQKVSMNIQLAINNITNEMYSSSAFVNGRTVFADGEPDSQDRRFFPQAGCNALLKIGLRF